MVLPELLVFGEQIILVFYTCSNRACLVEAPLGTMYIRWQFPSWVVTVRETLAPLSAGLRTAYLGASSLLPLVRLITCSVV